MNLTADMNTLWASLVIEELVRNGVQQFVISPGSRSTPLTAAAARHPQAHCFICHDERGAAFMALGYAKAVNRPAALVCTSGTAAANYFPAVIEASTDFIPMLVLSADRPPEQQDSGANQTIFQQKLFGTYARWFFQMPTPDPQIQPEFVLTTIDQAVARSRQTPAGPVHINFMFRKPLEPQEAPEVPSLENWKTLDKPYTRYQIDPPRPDAETIQLTLNLIQNTKQGLIVLGRLHPSQQGAGKILELIQRLGWPVYADIASGFRLGFAELPHVEEFAANLQPEPNTVLFLGGPILSKRVQQWLASLAPSTFIQVHNSPNQLDPNHQVRHRIISDVTDFCEILLTQLAPLPQPKSIGTRGFCQSALDAFFANTTGLSEPRMARLISQLLPKQHGLVLGNSMPVRDMNSFAVLDGASPHVCTNRGASGIDGTIASAVGFAAGQQQPVTLLIGDVAFLHDLNSLQLVGNSEYPIHIICLNNNGGGIFSFLPISQHKDVFPFFETPHFRQFEHAARLFDLNYFRPKTKDEFISVYQKVIAEGTSTLIEISSTTHENLHLHRKLDRHIQTELENRT